MERLFSNMKVIKDKTKIKYILPFLLAVIAVK